jgi:elongation factor G
MKITTTGDTLCNEDDSILLESIHYPETVLDMKIDPITAKERDKLGMALSRLALEDPSFRVRYEEETDETIISGMGELHLEIIVDRLKLNIRWTSSSESRPWLSAKPLPAKPNTPIVLKNRPVAKGNSLKSPSVWNRIPAWESNSQIMSRAVISRANSFPAVEKGFRETVEKGLLAAIQW